MNKDHVAFALTLIEFKGENLPEVLRMLNGYNISAEAFAGTRWPSAALLSVDDFTSLVKEYDDIVHNPRATDAQKQALSHAEVTLAKALEKKAAVDKIVSAADAALKQAQAGQSDAQKRIDAASMAIKSSENRITVVRALAAQKDALILSAHEAHAVALSAHAELSKAQEAYDSVYSKWRALVDEASQYRADAASFRKNITDRAAAREASAMAMSADGKLVMVKDSARGPHLANTGVALESLAASSLVALAMGLCMTRRTRREE